MSDVEGWSDSLIALQWTAHRPSRTFQGLLGLNRAVDRESIEAAVDLFEDPHQNVVYADTAGHIGYVMGGTVPVRGAGTEPPLLPVPGWTGDWDWTGTLPFRDHPRAFDPPAGFIVTANNRQVAGGVADRITSLWEPPFRAMRIEAMIRSSGAFDAADVHAMQLDVHDAFAARYRAVAVAAARAAGLADAEELLRDWDLRASPDSRAAALFNLWRARLRDALRADLYGGGSGYLPFRAFRNVLDGGALPWSSDDDLAGLAAQAMTTAAEQADGRTWGDLHTVAHLHPLGSVDILDGVLGLNVEGEAHAGSPTTVALASYASAGRAAFRTTSGPSMRHVSDLAREDGGAGFILGTGQSGLPFSDHYRDQFLRWMEGGLWRLSMDRAVVEARTTEHMTLEPER